MTNMIEESTDIAFKQVTALLCPDLNAEGRPRVMRAPPRPISIADCAEVCFENRFENARHRLLKQAVRDSGNSQRPRSGLARPLRYLNPPNRRSPVSASSKLYADLLNPLFQLALK